MEKPMVFESLSWGKLFVSIYFQNIFCRAYNVYSSSRGQLWLRAYITPSNIATAKSTLPNWSSASSPFAMTKMLSGASPGSAHSCQMMKTLRPVSAMALWALSPSMTLANKKTSNDFFTTVNHTPCVHYTIFTMAVLGGHIGQSKSWRNHVYKMWSVRSKINKHTKYSLSSFSWPSFRYK